MQEQPYTICIPVKNQIPLCTRTEIGPWYVIIAINADTQKQDADEKEFAEIGEKMTTQSTKQINAQRNLSVQIVEKDTWQGVTTVKMKWKKG